VATREKMAVEAENITNIELTMISTRTIAIKINFNEQTSKTVLLSRKKRKERK
jgi:hypothetical protein